MKYPYNDSSKNTSQVSIFNLKRLLNFNLTHLSHSKI